MTGADLVAAVIAGAVLAWVLAKISDALMAAIDFMTRNEEN